MKKTYSNPTLEVVKIQTQQMLAASDPVTGAKFDPSGSTSTMGGREGDLDDDF